MFGFVGISGGLNNQLPFGNHLSGVRFPPSLPPSASLINPLQTTELASIMSTAPNTPATYMAVGIENADASEPMVWFLDQAEYLLSLDTLPEILIHRHVLPESSVDPELAR